MVMPAGTITLSELMEFVKRQFGDESGIQITDSDIVRWVNMGAIEIVAKNGIIQATATATGTADTAAYDISTIMPSVIRIEDVSYGGRTLEPTDKSGLRKMIGTQETSVGEPIYWYAWANSIKLWPVPTADGTLSIDYIKRPNSVSNGSDVIPLPDAYYERLCNFVLSKAYELDEDAEKSTQQRQLFENKLTEMTGMDAAMSGSFPVVRDDYEGGYYGANWYGMY